LFAALNFELGADLRWVALGARNKKVTGSKLGLSAPVHNFDVSTDIREEVLVLILHHLGKLSAAYDASALVRNRP